MSDPITIGPAPAPVNLEIHRGAAFDFSFQLLDKYDAAVDCTDCTLHAELVSEEDGASVFDLAPTFTTESTGIGAIAKTAAQTETISKGKYLWNMLLEDTTGKILGPVMSGAATVKGRRTNA